MRALYLLAVWLHVLAAAVWVGGLAFLGLVLVPLVREPEHRAIAPALFQRIGLRFRPVGWACLGLLAATGLVQLGFHGFGWADAVTGRLWQGAFGRLLALKLLVVAALVALEAVHDFAVGPRAASLWRAAPDSAEAAALRAQASYLGRASLVLSVVAAALGVLLVRGLP